MTLFCHCGKIQNDPMMNPAKAIQKDPLNFADEPILSQWMNQAKTISLTLQMSVFCCCRMNKARSIPVNP